jgi:voltage-gated potassium channel
MPSRFAARPLPDRNALARAGRNAAAAALGLLALTLAGTLGYMAIEGMRFLDALYMTVITLTTVGYREVEPLSDAGLVFTMGLLAFGVGTVFYTVVQFGAFLMEGRLVELWSRRSTMRAIESLRDHVVICGFGRLGRAVAEQLDASGAHFVVIDPDEAARAECEARGWLAVAGSALDDETLALAGIERARALVAAIGSDADNVFIALSAREHNPALRIHARAETTEGVRRLRQAGASQVISPHQLGGVRIANAIVRPGVVEFLELSDVGTAREIDLEEVRLGERSAACGVRLRELAERGVRVSVVAIKRGDEALRLQPGPDDELCAGDRVVALGDRENLAKLAALADADARG